MTSYLSALAGWCVVWKHNINITLLFESCLTKPTAVCLTSVLKLVSMERSSRAFTIFPWWLIMTLTAFFHLLPIVFHSSLQRLSFLHPLLPVEMTYVYGLCSWRTHTLVSKVTQYKKSIWNSCLWNFFLTARFNLWAIQWILTNGCPTNSSSMVAIDDLRPKLTLAPSLTKDFILSFMISVIPSSSNAAVRVPVCY